MLYDPSKLNIAEVLIDSEIKKIWSSPQVVRCTNLNNRVEIDNKRTDTFEQRYAGETLGPS
ncbi:hypothetical protein B4919_03185 [Francisella tularensis subsp. novicida]|uniref:hypothetical protein n=1 Tax=Francisella tularensis TaxID=263 RepID=UPI000CE29B0F|nr:hypothetical protein [Francisella tularensis]AVC43853.1 hypothetical protein B4919_03185 [Francisella tularensis subsp. novicida]